MRLAEVKYDPNKRTLMGAIYHLMYNEKKLVKYLYRLMYYGGSLFMFFLIYISFRMQWWILLVIWCIITYGLLRKAIRFYYLDKGGIYDNTTFMNEIGFLIMGGNK